MYASPSPSTAHKIIITKCGRHDDTGKINECKMSFCKLSPLSLSRAFATKLKQAFEFSQRDLLFSLNDMINKKLLLHIQES